MVTDSKNKQPRKIQKKSVAFVWLSLRSHIIPFVSYSFGQSSHSGTGQRHYFLMVEEHGSKRTHGLGNMVATIFGKQCARSKNQLLIFLCKFTFLATYL